MDSLDIKIIREMFRGESFGIFANPSIALRDFARRLEVDKDTVRNRIKRFRDTGFLTGSIVIVNPNLFGVKEARLQFDAPTPSSKDDLIRKIKLIPGVALIHNNYGNSMLVCCFYETEQSLRKTIELISRISNSERLLRFDNTWPECRITLSKTDWSIIRSLQKDPRKSFDSVSRELRLSSRTVKRRLERLMEGKALTTSWTWNMKTMDATMAGLIVFYANPEHRGEIDEKILSHFDDYLIRAELVNKGYGNFALLVTNVAKAQEISAWMNELPGVSSYSVDLLQERIEVWGTFHELLEKKLAQIQIPA